MRYWKGEEAASDGSPGLVMPPPDAPARELGDPQQGRPLGEFASRRKLGAPEGEKDPRLVASGKAGFAAREAKRRARAARHDTSKTGPPCSEAPGIQAWYSIRDLAEATGWSRSLVRVFLINHNIPTEPPINAKGNWGGKAPHVWLSDLKRYAPKLVATMRDLQIEHERIRRAKGGA